MSALLLSTLPRIRETASLEYLLLSPKLTAKEQDHE